MFESVDPDQINLGLLAGVFVAPESIRFADAATAADSVAGWWGAVAALLGAVFALNLLLFVFNLLPVPPLDGSAALVLILPDSMVERYQLSWTLCIITRW